MEHAKKLILIEPRMLEQLQTHAEYKELLKDSDKKAKAGLGTELRKILDGDSDAGDDLKAKMYRQTFNKFQSVRNRIPETDKVAINSLTQPVVRQPPQQAHARRRAAPPHQKRPRRRIAWDQY